MPQRPTLATVVAILGMLYGASTLACTPLSLLFVLAPSGPLAEFMPAMPGWYKTFAVISGGLAILLALVLLIGSVGLWQLRSSSRKLLIAWAVLSLLVAVISTPVSLIYTRQMQEGVGGPAAAGALSGLIGGVLGLGFCLVLYGGMIFAMTRPAIIAACEGDEVGLPAETPVW
ncbi:MAG: hypothetical protein IT204_17410 [Fimbriimonadaceae bacterium]|nr:hypothetical protein [Fimbriimonadaceae bacterium]